MNSKGMDRRKLLSWAAVVALCYPLLNFLGFTVPKKPKMVSIHKSVSDSGFLVTREFILFDRQEKCWTLSRKCTHLGCRLNYIEELDLLECPCHQSRFSTITGEVIKGPAKTPLTSFPVEKRESDPFYVVTT
jgi:cytochrome b6-f complex iron-sulfur subunit